MKKQIILIIFIFFGIVSVFGQCNFKTTVRPEGDIIKYFNPQPVIRQSEYEVGISIYKNTTTNQWMLNISVLFKSMTPIELTGDAILQTSNVKGIRLQPLMTEMVVMNGRDLTIGLYEITHQFFDELRNNKLKSLFFYLDGNLMGSTVTENTTILNAQFNCYKKK